MKPYTLYVSDLLAGSVLAGLILYSGVLTLLSVNSIMNHEPVRKDEAIKALLCAALFGLMYYIYFSG